MLFCFRKYSVLLWGTIFVLCSKEPSENNKENILFLSFMLSYGNIQNSEISCPLIWRFSNIYLANKITEAPGATGDGFKNPTKAINGICGGGKSAGSLDVYSLQSSPSSTYCVPDEKCVVLEWDGKKVQNSSGIDFVVFENPFCLGGEINCSNSRFMEPVIVEVSDDGSNWCGWNPQYSGGTSESDKKNPNNWLRFAGIEPVLFNQETWAYDEMDIFDLSKAGGDGFDLSDGNFGSGCSPVTKSNIQTNGFIYIRLTSAVSRGFPYPADSFDQTADIDGVIARNVINR